LDAVVQEPVYTILPKDESGVDGFPEGRVCRVLCCPANQGQVGGQSLIAQAGELLQEFLAGARKPLELPGHEIHNVVGVALGADAIHLPLPSPRDLVERKQPLFCQRGEELDREERVASRLVLHQLR